MTHVNNNFDLSKHIEGREQFPANDNLFIKADGKKAPLPSTWVLYERTAMTTLGAVGVYDGMFAYLSGGK